jgi:hypothetical protein
MDWASSQAGAAAASYQAFMGPGMFRLFAQVLVEHVAVAAGDELLAVSP